MLLNTKCLNEGMFMGPGHGKDGPLLMVVAVTFCDVLPEHRQDPHHADGLLPGTVNAVLIPVQHTQRVIGGFEPVKARLNKILMDLYLQKKRAMIIFFI